MTITDTTDDKATADLTSECPTTDDPHWWQTVKAEHAALKQWKAGGEVGDRPLTPTLDDMNDRYIANGCAPGSSAPKRRRSTTSTPREPKMSDVDLTRRLRELLDATPTMSQSAATDVLTGEGATIRQVRVAYKVETANRPKPAAVKKAAPAKATTPKKAAAPAKKPTTSTTKKSPAKKAAPATAKKAAPAKRTKSPTPLLTDLVDDMMAGTLGTPKAKSAAPAKRTTSTKPADKPAAKKSTAKKVTTNFKATA